MWRQKQAHGNATSIQSEDPPFVTPSISQPLPPTQLLILYPPSPSFSPFTFNLPHPLPLTPLLPFISNPIFTLFSSTSSASSPSISPRQPLTLFSTFLRLLFPPSNPLRLHSTLLKSPPLHHSPLSHPFISLPFTHFILVLHISSPLLSTSLSPLNPSLLY